MKLALLLFGVLATGFGALLFTCLAIASSMAEEMARELENTLPTPPDHEK